LLTRPLPGSKRETVPSGVFATQTAPPPVATPAGPFPIGTASVTRSVRGSISKSCPVDVVTHTPSRPTAIPCGIVAAAPLLVSRRETVAPVVFATQTEPAPTAIALAPLPTWKVATGRSARGFTSDTVWSSWFTTQTSPPATATALGA
jgi:hypothetical protein